MLCRTWRANGQWNTLNSIKSIYAEPKFNDKHFTSLLLEYQAAACTSKGAVMLAVCRGKISEGLDLSDRYCGHCFCDISHFFTAALTFIRQSRTVLILGVPFLGAKDRCVQLKRDYNSRCVRSHTQRLLIHLTSSHCSVSSLLDGNTWYKMQVIRPIALGAARAFIFMCCTIICCRL